MLLLLLACTKDVAPADSGTDSTVEADADADADADTDTDGDADADTDTDTDTDPETEDCGDGDDNDGDGLVDCEDDDCVDVCIEDCENGEDDDADGLIDCDDDECLGEVACGGREFTIEFTQGYDEVVAVWGPLVSAYYPGTEGVGIAYDGAVTVYGYSPDPDTADTADDSLSFSCRGRVNLGSPELYDFDGMIWDTGYCAGCDAAFRMSPNDHVQWKDGSCPVTLPGMTWGFLYGETTIWSDVSGSWAEAYRTPPNGVYWQFDHEDSGLYFYYGEFDLPKQLAPVTWTGSYNPADL